MKLNMKKYGVLAVLVLIFGCEAETRTSGVQEREKHNGDAVQIIDKRRYYDIVLNYETGLSPRQMGQALGEKIQQVIPAYEALVDAYLTEMTPDDQTYREFLRRTMEIWPQVNPAYREEIEGLATQFSGGTDNVRGDRKLSHDEVYFLNLFPDVARTTQCNALAVFGPRSETQTTMLERTLDWPAGSQNQISQIHSVTTIRNGNKSVCLIGYAGFMGVITGFNPKGVFAGILDSSSGAPYSAAGKRSYPMDLRWALENQTTLEGVAGVMKDPNRKYAFSHLIFLADAKTAGILENNMSGLRALRSDTSALNPGITWGVPNAVGAVNAFMLKGNLDNFTGRPYNTARWASMKTELKEKGDVVTFRELAHMASHCTPGKSGPQNAGNLYSPMTQQIILFQPASLTLEVFFHPKTGNPPESPAFIPVPVRF